MPFVTLHMNANTNSATFGSDNTGHLYIDRSKLTDKERVPFREMIVDTWCKINGFAPLYS